MPLSVTTDLMLVVAGIHTGMNGTSDRPDRSDAMLDEACRKQLAAFLRSRRDRLSPLQAGLAPGPRRRAPGLRREEVAQLSGVSHTWYTWLEQAREITVSRQVLAALARALQLSADERQHLFALAGQPAPAHQPADAPSPLLRQMINALEPNPAYLVSPCWDLLAWNRAEAGLIGDPMLLPEAERNTVWLVFTDPALRKLFDDWATEAQGLLAKYRAAAGEHAGDPRFATLTEALHAASPEFRTWWGRHDIAAFQPARKRFSHPCLGALTFDYLKFTPPDNPNVSLLTYLPADRDTTQRLPGLITPD
jgi:transcriptional regulator with XRE-family HTH domain